MAKGVVNAKQNGGVEEYGDDWVATGVVNVKQNVGVEEYAGWVAMGVVTVKQNVGVEEYGDCVATGAMGVVDPLHLKMVTFLLLCDFNQFLCISL